MTMWIIEPRDPLIVRDGRPFGPNPGARATTLPFPFPSTIAGGLRSLAGRTPNAGFDTNLKDDVQQHIHVRGPLLVELDEHGRISWFASMPADASLHQTNPYKQEEATLIRFIPASLPADAAADSTESLLTQYGIEDINKAHPHAPKFWAWEHFKQWLLADAMNGADIIREGIAKLEANTRMHVKIASDTQTAEEGFLYQTRGLEFSTRAHKQLALATAVEVTARQDRFFAHFTGGMAPLGGERRLMHWETRDIGLPEAPTTLFEKIVEHQACRLVLLTPAYFAAGYKPEQLAASLKAQIVASAVPRAQVVSGWDMAANNGYGAPKPTRRLAPAGSVFFLRFSQAPDPTVLKQLWMSTISEDEQFNRDGVGLVALGVWDGSVKQLGAE